MGEPEDERQREMWGESREYYELQQKERVEFIAIFFFFFVFPFGS